MDRGEQPRKSNLWEGVCQVRKLMIGDLTSGRYFVELFTICYATNCDFSSSNYIGNIHIQFWYYGSNSFDFFMICGIMVVETGSIYRVLVGYLSASSIVSQCGLLCVIRLQDEPLMSLCLINSDKTVMFSLMAHRVFIPVLLL